MTKISKIKNLSILVFVFKAIFKGVVAIFNRDLWSVNPVIVENVESKKKVTLVQSGFIRFCYAATHL